MRSTKVWTIAYKTIGIMIGLLVVAALALAALNNAQLRATNQIMYADLQASQENAQSLYEQLLALGEEPEGEEPSEVTETTVPGVPGEPGPSGPRGDDGRAPTPDEILGAVAEYCATTGACQGTASTVPGPAGEAGADSTEPGPPGPAGAQGAQDEPGPPGPAGATLSHGVRDADRRRRGHRPDDEHDHDIACCDLCAGAPLCTEGRRPCPTRLSNRSSPKVASARRCSRHPRGHRLRVGGARSARHRCHPRRLPGVPAWFMIAATVYASVAAPLGFLKAQANVPVGGAAVVTPGPGVKLRSELLRSDLD